eukprot:12807556-Ditylum_brightwellii.AAC.1
MGAIPDDDKEGTFSDWFPQATEDPKEWGRRRRLLTPNLIGRKEQTEVQTVATPIPTQQGGEDSTSGRGHVCEDLICVK